MIYCTLTSLNHPYILLLHCFLLLLLQKTSDFIAAAFASLSVFDIEKPLVAHKTAATPVGGCQLGCSFLTIL